MINPDIANRTITPGTVLDTFTGIHLGRAYRLAIIEVYWSYYLVIENVDSHNTYTSSSSRLSEVAEELKATWRDLP